MNRLWIGTFPSIPQPPTLTSQINCLPSDLGLRDSPGTIGMQGLLGLALPSMMLTQNTHSHFVK